MEIKIIKEGKVFAEQFNVKNLISFDFFKLQDFKRRITSTNSKELIIPIEESNFSRLDLITPDGHYVSLKVRKLLILNNLSEINQVNYNENIFIISEMIPDKLLVVCFESTIRARDNDKKNDNHFLDYFVLEDNGKIMTIRLDQSKDERIVKIIKYYVSKLDELALEESQSIAEIDMPSYRKYFNVFKEISENENELIVPLKDFNKSFKKHKSIILETKDKKLIISNYEAIGTTFKIASDKKKKEINESFYLKSEVDVKLKNIGVIQTELAGKLSSRIISDSVTEVIIKDNLIGEKIRIERIIQSFIKSIGEKDVKNVELVRMLINNDYFKKYYVKNIISFDEQKEFDLFYEKKKESNNKINQDQALTLFKVSQLEDLEIDLMLIQGPPGTGKTEIIKEMVDQLFKENKKVLITSNVNIALDNMKERIKSLKEIILLEVTSVEQNKMIEERRQNIANYYKNQVYSSFIYEGRLINLNYLDILKEKLDKINLNLTKEQVRLEKINFDIISKEEKLVIIEKEINRLKRETEKISVISSYAPNLKEFLNFETKDYLNYVYGKDFIKYFNDKEIVYVSTLRSKIINTNNLIKNYSLIKNKKVSKRKFFDFILKNISNIKESLFVEKKIVEKYLDFYNRRKLSVNLDIIFNLKFKGTRLTQIIESLNTKFSLMNESVSKKYFEENIDKIFKIRLLNEEIDRLSQEKRVLEKKRLDLIDTISEASSNRENLLVELDKRKTKDQFVIKELKNTLRVRDSWLNYDIENEMNDYLNYLNSALEKNIDNQGKDNADFEKVFSSNSLERLFSLERNSNNNSGVVLAMTTNRTAILSKINFTFDYVIVDESSKCSLEDLIVVANVTKKMILIGDYMQLSPFNILNDETRKEFSSFMNEDDYLYLKDSKFYDLFDKTYRESIEKNQYIDNYNISLLKRQYRMRKDIYSLVSKVYDIHDGLSIETAVNDDQRSLIFIDVDGVEGKLDDDESSYNQAEVDFTSEIMDVLKDIGIKDNKVAFITGYKEQVSRINKIKNSKKLDYKVQIGTIDMFQGKEFDIVVLSMVRTERLGFMSEVRRLNVALSRGKKKLIVLGNKRRISKVLADELYRVNNEKDELRKKERISLLQNIIPHLLSYSTEFTGKSDNIKKLYDFLGDVNE